MDESKSIQTDTAEWLNQAKELARRHFDYNLNDEHEFWSFLKKYSDKNILPEEAVIMAVKDYGETD